MNSSLTMPTSPATPALDLTSTFGAFLIGIIFSAVLFGVTILQAFLYFQNYASDGRIIKGAVITIVICELLHLAFGGHAIYYYVISNYMNPAALAKATWSAIMTAGSSTLVISVVHAFYIRRIYHVSQKNLPLTILLAALALANFGASIAMVVRGFQLQYFEAFTKIKANIDAALSLAAGTDIMIAASLSYFLNRSRSGIQSTNAIINKLMVYAINNGILTSVFDILVVIFAKTQMDNLIFLSIFQVVGSLYTNSMLATLNSRNSIRSGKTGMHIVKGSSDCPLTSFEFNKNIKTSTEIVSSADLYHGLDVSPTITATERKEDSLV